ncbi:MAG TPA: hypothetical protein VM736_07585, partial [Gemmatimonadales bacterium]|nr:hypothetical protein [Gemmatimonadales bacterium]
MSQRARVVTQLIAAALLAAACSDAVGPARLRPGFAATAPTTGIALDQRTGALSETGTVLGQGFNPTNPHNGDAIIATFFWVNSTTPHVTITSVTDRLSNGTPVGNTYTLVDSGTSGGFSMATYVATNVQNFPDAGTTSGQILAVQAQLSSQVSDGGVVLSAWSGVSGVSTQAVGNHHSAAGSGSAPTTANPGQIAVNSAALVYGVSMASPVVGLQSPSGFTSIGEGSDASIKEDAEYAVPTSAGSADPQWTWYFDSTHPGTWLATVLSLNPAVPAGPPSQLAFTARPSTTTSGAPISPAVQVTAQDNSGNTATSFSGSVTIALGANPNGGTLSGTRTASAVNGVATFSNLSIDKPGSGYTLQATASGLTGATSATFTITPPGITLDQVNGTLNESGTATLIKGFNPTNPHNGDAIVATFFWSGSTSITRVWDHLTDVNKTPVGNTYNLVESVTSGGITMATYVATNAQNFPDASTNTGQILAVEADLSSPVTDGGLVITAWTGVAGVGAPHQSTSGSGSAPVTADPGAITLGAGAVAYAVTMANQVVPLGKPAAPFTDIGVGSDAFLENDTEYALSASGGSVDPQWTWYFDTAHPGTWLASVLALNPGSTGPNTGNLTATTSTSGSIPTGNYTVTVDGNAATSQSIAPNGSVTFTSLTATSH